MNLINKKVILFLILILALLIRIIDLKGFSPGLYLDEASMAYDAYSLGTRGTDQFGKSFPTYLRSFAMYQAPLYTYLSIIPIKLFGMNAIAIRLVSIVSGMLTILLVYFLVKLISPFYNEESGLVSAFVLSISPWHILFSRNALEANLGLFIFILSLYLLLRSVYKKNKYLIFFGLLTLAITSYAYHSYRFTSVIVLVLLFPIFFWNKLIGLRKIYLISGILFFLILIPQILIFNTPGSLRRYELLQYTSDSYFKKNGGSFISIPGGRFLFSGRLFLSKYFDYLSPRSIFLESDPAVTKSIPELSSFYTWMFPFFLLGLIQVIRKYHNRTIIFMLSVGLISLIPGAITTDNLYLLRVLNYLLVVSIIISLGLLAGIILIKNNFLKAVLLVSLLFISLVNLNINYFHLSKHERKADYSGLFNELFQFTKEKMDSHVVVELSEPNVYGIALYVYKYDPNKYQQDINLDLNNYYGDVPVPKTFAIENLSIRPIDWEKDIYIDQYLAGDERTIAEYKALESGLNLVKKFTANLDLHYVAIYKTNPLKKCQILLNKLKDLDRLDYHCKQILQ